MPPEFVEPASGLRARGFLIPIYLQISADERPDQPGPDRALMICQITAAHIAFASAYVPWIARRQAAQTRGRDQLALNNFNHPPGSLGVEHHVMQADCENLIRTDRAITLIAVNHVIQTSGRFVPELLIETLF